MRRHERWSRPLGAVMAVWFAALVLGAGLVHHCPAYGTTGSDATAGHGHAGHDGTDHGHHQHGCTCPALCCAAPVAWAGPGLAMPAAKSSPSYVQSAVPPTLFAAPLPDHLRPFATAPPSLATT